MPIKKSFAELVSYLEDNKNKKVDTLLPTIYELATPKTKAAKSSGKSSGISLKDSDGTVLAIKCWYFKRWMPIVGSDPVEFTPKKLTSTGYNSMCKEGNNLWSRQRSQYKKDNEQILQDVKAGDLPIDGISDRQVEATATYHAIQPTELGFETRDEVEAHFTSLGILLEEQTTVDVEAPVEL